MKYGLISANHGNIGDDIQSLAAERFLPQVDYEIDRERFWEFEAPDPVKVICNGWWAHNTSCWPPPECVDPLLISMHLDPMVRGLFIGPDVVTRYKHPFGARDEDTLKFLQAAKVPAYLSYCLTLTFDQYAGEKTDDIVCVDVDPKFVKHLGRPVKFFTHYRTSFTAFAGPQRRQLAKDLLKEYAKAAFVITNRLHCALPCIALGTPVIVVAPPGGLTRFSGYQNLLTICTQNQLSSINLEMVSCPEFDTIKQRLITTCTEFISN